MRRGLRREEERRGLVVVVVGGVGEEMRRRDRGEGTVSCSTLWLLGTPRG